VIDPDSSVAMPAYKHPSPPRQTGRMIAGVLGVVAVLAVLWLVLG
jgi:hypothetical protein